MARWTKRHQEISLEYGLPPAAVHLWQWLLRHESQLELHEIDLKDFNKWLSKKRGKPYHRDTIKTAISKLLEIGVIVGRKLGEYWYLWDLRVNQPQNLFGQPERKSVPNTPDETPEQPSEAQLKKEAFKQQQQLIIQLLEEHNLPISKDLIKRHCWKNISEWESSILLFYCRGGQEQIKNPSGWLNQCLKYRWWEEQELTAAPFIELINRVKSFDIWKKCVKLLGLVPSEMAIAEMMANFESQLSGA